MPWRLFGGGKSDVPEASGLAASSAPAPTNPHHLELKKIKQYGVPNRPTCMAHDPVQNIMAVGNRSGTVTLLGLPGEIRTFSHTEPVWLEKLIFVVNQGLLITVAPPKKLHIWDISKNPPELAHALELKYEAISCVILPTGSEWLHVGTEKGNVLFFKCTNFVRSSMDIMWNKAAIGHFKTHPGPVTLLSSNPDEPTKLLIGFELGFLVLWDVVAKSILVQYNTATTTVVNCVAWMQDSTMFQAGHIDGKVRCWSTKSPEVLESDSDVFEFCEPVCFMSNFKHVSNGSTLHVHDGGPTPLQPTVHLITIQKGDIIEKLEFPDRIVQHLCLAKDPWTTTENLPSTLAVLLENHLEFYDIAAPQPRKLTPPYGPGLEVVGVSCTLFVEECPKIFVMALKRIAEDSKSTIPPWPLSGGHATERGTRKSTLLITGHSDGSICFWNHAGAELLHTLYPPQICDAGGKTVHHIQFCCYERKLCVAHEGGTVLLYNFSNIGQAINPQVIEGGLLLPGDVEKGSPPSKGASNLKFMNQALKLGFTQEEFQSALKHSGGDGMTAVASLLEDKVNSIGDQSPTSTVPPTRQSISLTDGEGLTKESGECGHDEIKSASSPPPSSKQPAIVSETVPPKSPCASGGTTDDSQAASEESHLSSPPSVTIANEVIAAASSIPETPASPKDVIAGVGTPTNSGEEVNNSEADSAGEYLEVDDANDNTIQGIDLSYLAKPGFQLLMVCTCSASKGSGDRELIGHVSALRLCTAWKSFAFSNRFGVCLVNFEDLLPRTKSLSELEGLKSVKFSKEEFVLKQTNDSVTELAFAPAMFKGSDASIPAVWIGTSQGSIYTIPVNMIDSIPAAGEPIHLKTNKAVIGLHFSVDGGTSMWANPIPDMSVADKQTKESTIQDGSAAFKQLVSSINAAPNLDALKGVVNAIKISIESKELSDQETATLRAAYSAKSEQIRSEPSKDVDLAAVGAVYVWVSTVQHVMMYQCPSGSRKQKSSGFSLQIYKTFIASHKGRAVIYCLSDDGSLTFLDGKSLENLGQETLMTRPSRTSLRALSCSSRGAVGVFSEIGALGLFRPDGEIPEEYDLEHPLHVSGIQTPSRPAKKGLFGLFKKTPSDVAAAQARDELLGARVDDRESTAYSKRITGTAGINPEMARLREKMEQRKERLAQMEDTAAEMANHGKDFSDAATELANYYKNKRWWEL